MGILIWISQGRQDHIYIIKCDNSVFLNTVSDIYFNSLDLVLCYWYFVCLSPKIQFILNAIWVYLHHETIGRDIWVRLWPELPQTFGINSICWFMGPWMIMYIISSLWCWPKHWNKTMFFSNKWYVDIFKLQAYDIFLMQPLFKILFCYLYVACNDSQGYGSLMFETFCLFIIPLLCSTQFIIWGIVKHLQVTDHHITGIFSLIDYVGMLVTFRDSSSVSSLCNGPLQHCINLHIW